MKRWGMLLAVLLAIGLVLRIPNPSTDVAALEPVEVVLVRQSERMVQVQTDTGANGCGDDLTSAVEDLKNHAMGQVFLDTADYLLLDLKDMDHAELYPLFRPSCRVCQCRGVEDLQQAGAFLKNHRPQNSLLQLRADERKLETLIQKEGAMELVDE